VVSCRLGSPVVSPHPRDVALRVVQVWSLISPRPNPEAGGAPNPLKLGAPPANGPSSVSSTNQCRRYAAASEGTLNAGARSSMAWHVREVSDPVRCLLRARSVAVRGRRRWLRGRLDGACGGEIFSEASGCRAQDERRHRGSEEQ